MEQIKQFISNLLDEENVCFIGSVNEEGFPNIRAFLQPRKREGIETIYFSTNTSTNKIKHFQLQNKSCVYVYNANKFQGALLIGTMEVLKEQYYKEMLWQTGDELYYQQGIADLDYCILRFTTNSGRIYQNFASETFSIH